MGMVGGQEINWRDSGRREERSLCRGQVDGGTVAEAVAEELEQDRGEDSDWFANPPSPRSLVVARSGGALKTKRRGLGMREGPR